MECKIVVADGEEALRKIESFHLHVLVLDVMIPKLSGYDVCRKLQDRKDITILLLTVNNDIVDKLVRFELEGVRSYQRGTDGKYDRRAGTYRSSQDHTAIRHGYANPLANVYEN